MTTTIVIADDHGLVRAGLRAMLETEADFRVLGDAENGHEAVRLAETLRPDILITDVSMPGLTGIEVAAILQRRAPSVRVLLLTMHDDPALAQEALRVGALGYITKRAVESELVGAIQAVARGETYTHYSNSTTNRSGLRPGYYAARHELDVRSFRFVYDERSPTHGSAKYTANAMCTCGYLLCGSGSTLASATAQLEDALCEHLGEFFADTP